MADRRGGGAAGADAGGPDTRAPLRGGGRPAGASADGVHPCPDGGRGRLADTPAEISPRGWRDVLIRVFRAVSDDRVLTEAAGITFYALLAILPAIGALVSLYGLFADPLTV